MSSTVEQIKARLGIAEVLESYIKLEKAGANYKARCPFHNEKTPSFYVSTDRNTFYCFGCGAKGDIFSFVEQFENVDFRGALKTLAERAGVELTHERPEVKSERDRLYSAMEHAAFFFQKNLGGSHDALLYLKKRGLKIETVREWRIGWALPEWSSLHAALRAKGFTDNELERAGLVKRADSEYEGQKGARHYDRFRGRIMFPIFDSSGRVIAFSGRILIDDEKSAKYINSPETPLWNKSATLYGFHRAKLEIRKRDAAIVVEGQMDLLMSHQAGITNTVAVSGTALTPEHLGILKRLSNSVILAFDSDSAGFKAAMKSAEAALGMGIDVKVVNIEGGKDPADIVLADPEAWKKAVAHAEHVVPYVLGRLLREHKEDTDPRVLGKEVQTKVLPYVARIESAIDRSHFIQIISHKAGIREAALWEEMRKIPAFATAVSGGGAGGANSPGNTPHGGKPSAGTSAAPPRGPVRTHSATLRILGALFWQETKKEPTVGPEEIRTRLAGLVGKAEADKLEKEISEQKSELVFEAELFFERSQRQKEALDELFKTLEEEILKDKLTKTMKELQEAERTKEKAKVEQLIKLCQELSGKLRDLNTHI